MEETPLEFQNENVKVQVHHKPKCVVEYEVEAFAPLVLEAQKKALRAVAKGVVIPGFRKGRAPVELVAKRHPQEVDRRWQNEIADLCYLECAKLTQIPLIRPDASITFKMVTHNHSGAKLNLSFETVPVIPKVDPSTFTLKPVDRVEVTPEKVAEAIRQIRFFFATWKQVENRPIQEGDYIILDMVNLETDPPQGVFQGVRFEVTDRSMAKWMKDLVIGQGKGSDVEGISIPDENLPEEEKQQYKPQKVRITIREIEEADLPPVDENLSMQLGVSNAEQLEERVAAILNKIAEQHARDEQREQVSHFLASLTFDLPQSTIEKEAQFRMQQMMQDPAFAQGWQNNNEEGRRKTIQEALQLSEKAVRLFYLCRAISAQAPFTISAKDIQTLPTDPLEALLNPNAQIHDPREPDIKQAEAYSRLLFEKAADWVWTNASQPAADLA